MYPLPMATICTYITTCMRPPTAYSSFFIKTCLYVLGIAVQVGLYLMPSKPFQIDRPGEKSLVIIMYVAVERRFCRPEDHFAATWAFLP